MLRYVLARLTGTAVGAIAIVLAINHGLRAYSIPDGTTGIDTATNIMSRIQTLGGFVTPDELEVFVLGDSTLLAYPATQTVARRIQEAMSAKADRHVNTLDVSGYGLSAFEYYPFSVRIAETRPDAVVLGFNLASLSPRWKAQWSRPEMLGWLRLRQIPDAISRPLHYWGVTFDRVLLYTGLVRLGQVARWNWYRKEQIRTSNAVAAIRLWLQSEDTSMRLTASGLPAEPPAFANATRFTAPVMAAIYGQALAGVDGTHPTLQLLAHVLSDFERFGVTSLVYVVPANVEYLRALGIMDETGLMQTLQAIESVATAEGAMFLDLHALLPDAGFRDAGGHFTLDDELDGPQMVAQPIAEAFDELFRR